MGSRMPYAEAAPPSDQLQFTDPDHALGANWRRSTDLVAAGVGDTKGYQIEIARERDAFRWSTLATLAGPNPNGSPWTGYTCLTGSGKYVAAVFVPVQDTNRPEVLQAGALAAVVDVDSGQARMVADDVALSYFSPACGPGDEVLLTRSIGADEQETDLLHVDAAKGQVTSTSRVRKQLTNMVPAKDGTYGVAQGALVKVADSGTLTQVGKLDGRPFAVVANNNGVDLLEQHGDRAVAQRFADGRLSTFADAPLGRLQMLALRGGRTALVGDTGTINPDTVPGLATFPWSGKEIAAISADGDLIAGRVASPQVSQAAKAGPGGLTDELAGRYEVSVRAPRSGATRTGEIVASRAPRLMWTGKADTANPGARIQAVNVDSPTCAVLRNDLHRQVLQPTAPMGEWAADLAVKGALNVQRPADYLRSGLPAYSPQGLFPLPALRGGGTVPAQVLLGIMAQESNFRQATPHARPGDGGNVLVGNYYGLSPAVDKIDYTKADCGYGITQVTDGMRKTDTVFNPTQQAAVAIDYAANIAAGLRILATKWNELYDAGMLLNGGDPRFIENWFFATWTYNSGFHPPGAGDWGVGWLNNPANPRYKPGRNLFLRDTYDDAAHPGFWSYPEKILGWIETPQKTYFGQESYKSAKMFFIVHDPGLFQFCTSVNNCSQSSPCPAENSSCWFHGSSSWANCANTGVCSFEDVTYAPGSGEPPMKAQYPDFADCARPGIPAPELTIVDDIPDSALNIRGCPGDVRGGKFTLRTGGNQSPNAYIAQIDLHSFGAGYKGHMWFTHTYKNDKLPESPDVKPAPYVNQKFQVTGTWSPDLPREGCYQIETWMPSHGAEANVTYVIFPGIRGGVEMPAVEVSIQQTSSDTSKILTRTWLSPGARVMLSNLTNDGDGSKDIVFDQMAFWLKGASTPTDCR
ncbi:hypothetical protein [Actinocrispum wychmicini]|nr:hypothetical protein [Actinocrispum wychmicini]